MPNTEDGPVGEAEDVVVEENDFPSLGGTPVKPKAKAPVNAWGRPPSLAAAVADEKAAEPKKPLPTAKPKQAQPKPQPKPQPVLPQEVSWGPQAGSAGEVPAQKSSPEAQADQVEQPKEEAPKPVVEVPKVDDATFFPSLGNGAVTPSPAAPKGAWGSKGPKAAAAAPSKATPEKPRAMEKAGKAAPAAAVAKAAAASVPKEKVAPEATASANAPSAVLTSPTETPEEAPKPKLAPPRPAPDLGEALFPDLGSGGSQKEATLPRGKWAKPLSVAESKPADAEPEENAENGKTDAQEVVAEKESKAEKKAREKAEKERAKEQKEKEEKLKKEREEKLKKEKEEKLRKEKEREEKLKKEKEEKARTEKEEKARAEKEEKERKEKAEKERKEKEEREKKEKEERERKSQEERERKAKEALPVDLSGPALVAALPKRVPTGKWAMGKPSAAAAVSTAAEAKASQAPGPAEGQETQEAPAAEVVQSDAEAPGPSEAKNSKAETSEAEAAQESPQKEAPAEKQAPRNEDAPKSEKAKEASIPDVETEASKTVEKVEPPEKELPKAAEQDIPVDFDSPPLSMVRELPKRVPAGKRANALSAKEAEAERNSSKNIDEAATSTPMVTGTATPEASEASKEEAEPEELEEPPRRAMGAWAKKFRPLTETEVKEQKEAREVAKKAEEARKAEEEVRKALEAEEARKAEEERKAIEAEEARKAEEVRKATEAEKALKAEEDRKEAEKARKAEEARNAKAAKAEEARKAKEAEEARKAEQDRRAKEAEKTRKAEEARKAKEAEESRKAKEAEEARKAKDAEEARKATEAMLAQANFPSMNGRSSGVTQEKNNGHSASKAATARVPTGSKWARPLSLNSDPAPNPVVSKPIESAAAPATIDLPEVNGGDVDDEDTAYKSPDGQTVEEEEDNFADAEEEASPEPEALEPKEELEEAPQNGRKEADLTDLQPPEKSPAPAEEATEEDEALVEASQVEEAEEAEEQEDGKEEEEDEAEEDEKEAEEAEKVEEMEDAEDEDEAKTDSKEDEKESPHIEISEKEEDEEPEEESPRFRPRPKITSKVSLLSGTGYLGPRRVAAANGNAKVMSVDQLLTWRDIEEESPEVMTCVAMEYEEPVASLPETPSRSGKGGEKGRPGSTRNSKGGSRGDLLRRRSSDDFERPAPQALEVSSSSWVAQQRSLKSQLDEEQDQRAVMTRKIRALLNKLTLEKFGTLLQQLMECGISTHEDLEILMHEIMEKATTQHHFIAMYTDLCVALQEWSAQNDIGDKEKGSFKRILLLECQASFERYLKPPEHLESQEDRLEAETKYKTAMLGNIRFVGELLSKNMVASQVIFAVVNELLKKPYAPERLECLAAFLTRVGGMFDKPDWKYIVKFRGVFGDIKAMMKDSALPARIRFLLADVIDLRAAGWQDQKQATKSQQGPMTLDEVHKHAEAGSGAGSSKR